MMCERVRYAPGVISAGSAGYRDLDGRCAGGVHQLLGSVTFWRDYACLFKRIAGVYKRAYHDEFQRSNRFCRRQGVSASTTRTQAP